MPEEGPMTTAPSQYAGNKLAEPVSPLQGVINNNGELTDRLRASVERLAIKLKPVVNIRDDRSATDEATKGYGGSSIVTQLEIQGQSVQSTIRFIDELTNSLEV